MLSISKSGIRTPNKNDYRVKNIGSIDIYSYLYHNFSKIRLNYGTI